MIRPLESRYVTVSPEEFVDDVAMMRPLPSRVVVVPVLLVESVLVIRPLPSR